MGLSREETIKGTLAEYQSFLDLLRSLSDEQWRTPTRCEGWEVRDVAGHVVGLASDVARAEVGQRTADEQAAQLRDRSAAEQADELAQALAGFRPIIEALDDAAWEGPSPAPPLTMRQGVETLWYDTYVHADDIRVALRQESRRGAGAEASARHLAELLADKGWGPATLALDGMEEVPVGAGGGQRVTGDPYRFVMIATGRADPSELGLDEKVNVYG